MKKSLFLAVFFLCASCFYAVRLYKTKEIPFLDDAVEGFTEVIGFKPEVVQKKIEKKEQVIEKAKAQERLIATSQLEVVVEQVKKEEPKKEDMFGNIATTSEPSQELKETATQKEEEKKSTASNLFGNIAADENDSGSTNETRIPIDVSVYKTQEVKNDGVLMLRLESDLRMDKKSFPKGFVFEANTAIHSGRLVLRSDKLGTPVLNYENGFEGQTILKKWLLKKGEVTLSEGEKITLYY